MLRNYLVPVLGAVGLTAMLYSVRSQATPAFPQREPAIGSPARSPFPRSVSGSGLVEAASENIAVAPALPGRVAEVLVQPGDRVKAGDALFRIEDHEYRAELAVREAALAEARAELARLRALPRPEDLPPAEADVRAAEAEASDARRNHERAATLHASGAISREDLDRRLHAAQAAEARAERARASLERLRAGAWAPELAAAQAAVASAEARSESLRVDLDRLVVRAPISGQVLSSVVRPGQYAAAGAQEKPLMQIGDTEVLRLRVDVDENDAWRVRPEATAIAFLRGNPAISAPVTFLRFEPAVVPKSSLTGAKAERTDTRVLQVIYTVPSAKFPAFVGQLVDVRIEDAPGSDALAEVVQ